MQEIWRSLLVYTCRFVYYSVLHAEAVRPVFIFALGPSRHFFSFFSSASPELRLVTMLLSTLATVLIAQTAAAASSSSSCSFSTTVTDASGVLDLNACPTLDGTIEISGDDISSLDLSSVDSIKGDVDIFNSSSITSISLSSLVNITGSLLVEALTQLHNIDFSKLSLAKELLFISLPSLAVLNLNSGLANVSSLTLSDTALSDINSLIAFNEIDSLNVNNNKNVSSIDLSGLKTVSDSLVLSFNNDNATVKLDNLIWAANLTIQDVAEISISSLEKVNGSFNLAYNDFDSAYFDSLTEVGSSLQVFANDNLEALSFENLTTINGEFRVFNNSLLEEIELENLETVKGAISMSGSFDNFTLPSLKEVDGDFSISSTSEDFSCDAFDKLHDDDKIKGHNYNCSHPESSLSVASTSTKGSSSSSSTSSSSSSSSSDSSSSSSSKKSGAAYLTPGMLISSVIGAGFAFLL